MRYFKKFISAFICAVMLITTAASAENAQIISYSNGNNVSNTNKFNNGIFSAVSSGSGLFAIALYKDNELAKLSFAQSEDELNEYRVNMLIEDAEKYTMKIFRFSEDGTPLCVNKSLLPKADDTKIYFNETFDTTPKLSGAQPNGTTTVLSDGRLNVTGDGTRFGTFPVYYPEENIIIEADFELPSDAQCFPVRLMSIYHGGPVTIAYMSESGIKKNTSGAATNKVLVDDETIESDGKFNLALKLDLKNLKYDIYYNRNKVNSESFTLTSYAALDGFAMHIPILGASGTIYVDNIKAYSGTEFKDIGNAIANVHAHDFKNTLSWASEIYERPDAEELAEKILAASHPRVLINSKRVEEIKASNDEKIKEMKETVISLANRYLSQNTYTYSYSNTGSIGNVSEAMSLMMNLGMAYLLTGNSAYSDRAYKEAEVLFDVASTKTTPEGGIDYWNSYSYLDVSEISGIMAICYDWMYDAWTPEQKEALAKNTIEKGILRSYRGIYNQVNPTTVKPTDFTHTNNWGAVCNGDMLMASVAFMEAEPYMCSQLAEANIRALEHFLPSYAPSGAWAEGASYWAYALRHLTYALATLESSCGTDYGLSKAQGLEGTQLYSIASEGKVGVVNYGDVGSSRVNAPFMFYWAKKFNNSDIGGAAAFIKDEYKFDYGVADLIYYDSAFVSESYTKPLSFYYTGTELVTFSSNSASDGSFVSVTGGKGVATSHDHLDSGSIIAEKNGVRIISDTGAEHYGAESYFSTNRYWYYKARPEGHNIFVINPQNLTNGTTTDDKGNVKPVYYHGQSRDAVSLITNYDPENKTAVMDLSAAYSRDASNAKRKISLVDESIVIEDEITVKSDANLIEWYYHFKDTATAVVGDATKYSDKTYCESTISDDKKSVTLTFYDYTYDSGFKFSGTSKSFTISFETVSDYEIEIRDAVRNSYDKDIISGLAFSGDYHNSRNVMSKIVVKMADVSGTVNLKTIIE